MEWFLDTGLWIVVAVAAAAGGYLLVRLGLRRGLPRVARWLAEEAQQAQPA